MKVEVHVEELRTLYRKIEHLEGALEIERHKRRFSEENIYEILNRQGLNRYYAPVKVKLDEPLDNMGCKTHSLVMTRIYESPFLAEEAIKEFLEKR